MTAVHHPTGRNGRIALATSIATLCLLAHAHAQFEISSATGNTAQDFNTLIATGNGTWINDTTLAQGDSTLDGWSLFTFGLSPIGAYNSGTGSSTTGSFYSFGQDTVAERALGGLGSGGAYFGSPPSGTTAGYIAFAALNNSNATLTGITLGFDGEQWRNGGNNSPQTMTLEYGFGSTFDTVTWTAPGGTFNWASPVTGPTGAAVDGNTTGLVENLGGTISGLNWTTGETLWLRWIEVNDTGNDHALAIDDFAISWTGAVIDPLYWDVNGATAGVGGTGTWNGANLNWNLSAAGTGAPQVVDPAKRLIFAGAGGTITVDAGGVAANIGMEFTAPYTLNGGNITLGNIPSINTASAVTINSLLGGTSGLTKLGPETLTLTNAGNTFTGVISINAGALAVANDGALGAAENDVVLSGGLLSLGNSFVMGANRALSGGGGLRILVGNTLTTQGTVNLSSVDISSDSAGHTAGGTLAVNGSANTLGNVTFSDPATVTSNSNLNLNGNLTMAPTVAGPVAISANTVSFLGGVQKFTVVDTPAAIDATITGALGGSGKLHKVGTGTLRLVGDTTSFPGGVRLGTAGTTLEPGGRLIIGDTEALGTGSPLDFQFNDGTLEAEAVLTGAAALPVGVSFGAGAQGDGTFTGSAMEFLGDLSLFKGAGTAIEHRMRVDTDVTFRGFGAAQGTGTSTGLLVTGTRTLTFKDTGATTAIETINIEGPTVVVNGGMTGNTINVRSGTLKGIGPLGGILTIGDATGNNDAILEPGTVGVGTLPIGGLTLLDDAVLRLELDRQSATADKILADGPIELGTGVAALQLILLNAGTLTPGAAFTIIDNSAFGTTIGTFEGLADDSTFVVGGLPFTINYNGGPEFNDVVLTYVPEPGSVGLLAIGALAVGLRRRPYSISRSSRPAA